MVQLWQCLKKIFLREKYKYVYFPTNCMMTLPIDVASSSCSLKLHPLVCVNDCITISFLIFWYGSGTWELEGKRKENLTLSASGLLFFFHISFSLTMRLAEPDWGRVVAKKIVYSEWWLFRAWLTTVCWKVFDIFLCDSSNHVGQEKILIFLIGIQKTQELKVPFKSDGSHFCLSDTVKEFISSAQLWVYLCLEKALWTHFISSAKEDDSSLL